MTVSVRAGKSPYRKSWQTPRRRKTAINPPESRKDRKRDRERGKETDRQRQTDGGKDNHRQRN